MEFVRGTSLSEIFREFLKKVADAHGVKKSVKIISLALYLILNVVVRGDVDVAGKRQQCPSWRNGNGGFDFCLRHMQRSSQQIIGPPSVSDAGYR